MSALKDRVRGYKPPQEFEDGEIPLDGPNDTKYPSPLELDWDEHGLYGEPPDRTLQDEYFSDEPVVPRSKVYASIVRSVRQMRDEDPRLREVRTLDVLDPNLVISSRNRLRGQREIIKFNYILLSLFSLGSSPDAYTNFLRRISSEDDYRTPLHGTAVEVAKKLLPENNRTRQVVYSGGKGKELVYAS